MARIARIKIERLYGYFNYEINLNPEERVTIVHGPNGYGKTNLLKLVHAFGIGDYATLIAIPFRRVCLELDDGRHLDLTRLRTARIPRRHNRGPHSCFDSTLISPNEANTRSGEVTGVFLPVTRRGEEDFIPIRYPELIPEGNGKWRSPDTGELFTEQQLLTGESTEVVWTEPHWLRSLRKECCSTLIGTERLYDESMRSRSNSPNTPRFRLYDAAKHLAAQIRTATSEFAATTVRLEESFAVRILSAASPSLSGVDETELRAVVKKRLAAIKERRTELESLALLEPQSADVQVSIDTADVTTLHFLDRYTADVKTKLDVFDHLASRLVMLQKIINRNFFFKQIFIDRNSGWVVRSTIDGYPLSLAILSAGEQQEILMLHKLLFDIPPGTLVLLDEPEISLHVEWQEEFIRDLIAICSLGGFDAIVATHSPVLVGDFWHLTKSLSEQAGALDDLIRGYEQIVEQGTWGELSTEEDGLHDDGDVPF